MDRKDSEPLLSHEEVQRMIDERLDAILQQEAAVSGLAVRKSGNTEALKCHLKQFWKKIIKKKSK